VLAARSRLRTADTLDCHRISPSSGRGPTPSHGD
jgi:hypothetical protein